jgi:adenylosuccinate lyase
MKAILKDLIVHEQRISQNVDRAATLISTEALMFYLGETIGKQTAHKIVYETSMEAIETNQPLIDLLMNRNEISGKFKREDLEKTIDPMNHIGVSQELTRRVIEHVKEQLGSTVVSDGTERTCPLADKDGQCTV